MKIVSELPTQLDANCETHGAYKIKCQDYAISGKYMIFDHCPECAREANEKAEQEARVELEAQQAQNRVRSKMKAGLRKRHIDCTLDNYSATTEGQQKALGKAREFLSNTINGKGGNLVLAGRVGTGKTHLAAAIVSALVDHGRSASLIKMPELIREIKHSWSRDSGTSESAVIDYYSRVGLLALDEVGVQFGTDTEKLLVSEIIDNRYQELLPTVLISNLDIKGIRECIGERCYDRLKEDGGQVIAFDWDSARGAA
jgi:DNA replication protein DnaC